MAKDNIPKVYEPQSFEKRWYEFWEKNDLFHAEPEEGKKPFSIVIPPPNVTGQLHMGHALDNTLQDILIRWRRMQGYNTLWMPGCDHAGIATQAKVEAALRAEGTNSGARSSRSASGSGRRSTAAASCISSERSALRAIGRASASRWTRAARAPCARSS